jgi:signal transduction histidine kinase
VKSTNAGVRRVTQDGRLIPVALAIAALTPVVCVLWFMSLALRNERLAVRERLTQVYAAQLDAAQRAVEMHWRERLERLNSVAIGTPAERFAAIARSNLAASAVIYDSSGSSAYPALPESIAEPQPLPAAWNGAQALEFQHRDFTAAATAYAQIARTTESPETKAAALQAQANCAVQLGNRFGAIEILEQLLAAPELCDATGPHGILMGPNAALRLMQLTQEADPPRFDRALDLLNRRLNDYSDGRLSSGQRLFLMEEIRTLAQDTVFPTLDAERLAAEYLSRSEESHSDSRLYRTRLAGVWHAAASEGSIIALYREAALRGELEATLQASRPTNDFIVQVLPPSAAVPSSGIGPRPLMNALPEWQLALRFAGEDPFTAASRRQTTIYLASGGLVAVTILTLAVVIARHLRAQMRLTRLKNELVSTVSHELRTPLASMRALVETLLAGRIRGEAQVREYLQLIARENQRLSHLIENFLTFSRMERGQHRFRFEPMAPALLVQEAVAAMGERLKADGCRFEQTVPPDLPEITADRDAMTTVLINLLDNAIKYSEQDKRIALRVHPQQADVCFEVQDHGIGLNRAELARIFDRFYQVDQSLTRQRGGCGLGLSIVQYVMRAHGGEVEVESEPGRGSRFRVRLPLANEPTRPQPL